MSDALTILVDTELERDDAAAAATELYRRLVGDGTLAAAPSTEGDTRFLVLNGGLIGEAGVHAIGFHATGHRWCDDDNGGAMLVDGGHENGIFCPYDGSFSICCPECRQLLAPGDEGSEALEEALAVWVDAPSSAYVACPGCAAWSPLGLWQSPKHDFAVGHFAITLYGAHLRSLTGGGDDHAGALLRYRLGDLAGDFSVVFARA